MSQENVEVFERAVAAVNRGDVEALLSELDPEVEWDSAFLMGMTGKGTVYRGLEGIREFFGDVDEALSVFDLEYSEIRELGDRIVALGRLRTRGTASGAELESLYGSVVDLKNGKVIRVRTFLDHTDALEAAGLEE